MITCRLLSLSLICSAVSLVGSEETSQVTHRDLELRPAAEARSPAERMHSLIFAAIDLDRDGVLSAGEMTNASLALRALDLNEDGLLAVDELRRVRSSPPVATTVATNARGPRAAGVSPGFVLAFTLDANHDGLIQTMEMANAARSLMALDGDGDGQVTLRELRPVAVASQSQA